MKIEVIGGYGGESIDCRMTCVLINDRIALDAGSLTQGLELERQARVSSIVLTHSHLDHTCSLPFLIDNNFSAPGFTLRIYAIPEVIASMRDHLFNNHTWPDFTCLPNDLTPVLKLVEVPLEKPFAVNGITLRAIKVSHLVPTTGFIVEDDSGAIAYSSDTGPTGLVRTGRKGAKG